MMSWHIESPRPVPSPVGLVVKNGLNIFSFTSGGIPVPLSRILISTRITRVFLNLISNGFYATSERGAATTASDYEPTIVASTKNLGDRVEIRIRDNGTGMPPDVKEKMFNPFFTTKPTGEGTGLGLSMCHDIIVKQHAGSIDVDTQPGEFTEIIVTLPRAAVFV